ncbi:hypothetical protein ACH35V_40875 [Actinomadura sp. 1N219]|uniref:hypothetical protein n=1 Tax=Actinomadura sp. 1N219 TaxID=3375152 RepID=UPI0037902724
MTGEAGATGPFSADSPPSAGSPAWGDDGPECERDKSGECAAGPGAGPGPFGPPEPFGPSGGDGGAGAGAPGWGTGQAAPQAPAPNLPVAPPPNAVVLPPLTAPGGPPTRAAAGESQMTLVSPASLEDEDETDWAVVVGIALVAEIGLLWGAACVALWRRRLALQRASESRAA